MKKSIKIVVLFLLAVTISFLLSGRADAQATKIRGNQIADSAISVNHLSSALLGQLIFEVSGQDCTAWYAKLAKGLVDGVVVFADFSSGLQDSIISFLVEHSDSADYAISLAKEALSDTSQIEEGLRNKLFGYTSGQELIYKAKNAKNADSSDYADEAGHAQTADTALVTNVAFAEESNHALTADFAYSTLAPIDSIGWNSLNQAVKDSINYGPDSAAVAKSVKTNGITTGLPFTTAVKDTYMTTFNQNAGLDNAANAITGANPVMETTTANKSYVQNTNLGVPNLYMRVAGTAAPSNFELVSDTTLRRLRFKDGDGTASNWLDSAAIYTFVSDTVSDYVLKGTGGYPNKVFVTNSDPAASASTNDIWFQTLTDSMRAFYRTSTPAWKPLTAATAATIAASLSRSVGIGSTPVSVDSVAYRDVNQVVSGQLWGFPHYLDVDTIRPYASTASLGDSTGNTSGLQWPNAWIKRANIDTLGDGNSNSLSNIVVVDTLIGPLTSGFQIGISPSSSTRNPRSIFAKDTIMCSAYGSFGGFLNTGSGLITSTPGVANIGSPSSSFDTAWVQQIIMDEGGSATAMEITSAVGGGISIIDGNIVLAGTGAGVTGASGTFTTISSGTNNSTNYQLGGTPAWPLFSDDYNAVTSACAADSGNMFVTRSYMRQAGKLGSTRYSDPNSYYGMWFRAYNQMVDFIQADGSDCLIDTLQDILPEMVIPLHIDSGWTPINPNLFPQPAIDMVGLWDSTRGMPTGASDTNRSAVAILDPVTWTRRYNVIEEYPDTLGYLTGTFGTIQGALSHLPNVQVIFDESSSGDTLIFNPSTDTKYRFGSIVKQSVTSPTAIPAAFKVPGVMFCYTSASVDSLKRWVSISGWVNDSVALLSDTTVFDGTVSVTNGTGLLAFQSFTVNVNPRKLGGMWQVDSLLIDTVAPVIIQGTGPECVLSNVNSSFASSSNSSTIFSYLSDHGGMPVTIRNMSVVSTGSDGSVFYLYGGAVTIDNVTAVHKGTTAMIEYGADNDHDFRYNSFVIENSVMSIDSDYTMIYAPASCGAFRFLSQDNTYSIGGNSGKLLLFQNTNGTAIEPHLIRDNIYTAGTSTPSATFTVNIDGSRNDSLVVIGCWFSGKNVVYSPSGDVVDAHLGGNNTFNSAITSIPVKISESQKWFKDGVVSPK